MVIINFYSLSDDKEVFCVPNGILNNYNNEILITTASWQ